MTQKEKITYKIYLAESEMPTQYYNVRAAMKKDGLTMAELRRNAEEVLSFVLHSSAELREK